MTSVESFTEQYNDKDFNQEYEDIVSKFFETRVSPWSIDTQESIDDSGVLGVFDYLKKDNEERYERNSIYHSYPVTSAPHPSPAPYDGYVHPRYYENDDYMNFYDYDLSDDEYGYNDDPESADVFIGYDPLTFQG